MRENHERRRGLGFLSVIARHARRNDVAGSVASAFRQRNDVILREPVRYTAAICAALAISLFHHGPLFSGEIIHRASALQGFAFIVCVAYLISLRLPRLFRIVEFSFPVFQVVLALVSGHLHRISVGSVFGAIRKNLCPVFSVVSRYVGSNRDGVFFSPFLALTHNSIVPLGGGK